MNREYMIPKILIFFFLCIFMSKPVTWYMIVLYVLFSILGVIIYEVIKLALLGKYYLYLAKKGKGKSREKIHAFIRNYIFLINRILRLEVIVEGYDFIDPSKNYLITPNHQSNIDATVLIEALKMPYLYVSKFSMSKVIIVKDWMKLIECLYLKKDDMRGQIIVMNEVIEKLKEGKNVVIFPEGKRSFGKELNEFKAGTFKVAQKTHIDILPITLNNVYQQRHRYPWKKTVIKVYIHKPITIEEYEGLNTSDIAALVQERVKSKIE